MNGFCISVNKQTMLFHFRYVTNKIVLTSQESTVINLFAILRVFQVNSLALSLKRVTNFKIFGEVNRSLLSFGFMEALDSKGILNALKKGIKSVMELPDVLGFTFVT